MSKYLNVGLLKNIGVVGIKKDNKLKVVKLPISDKTYELLRMCKFTWWSPSLSGDINNPDSDDKIEDKLSDIFYIILGDILSQKFGVDPNEIEYYDADLNDNEILIDIELQ